MGQRGVTLIELLIVVSIIGILAIALGFSYVGWQGAYKVESATKQIYADLLSAKSMAMTRSYNYFVDFPSATTYRISQDDSDGTAKVTGGDDLFEPQVDPNVVTPDTDTTLTTFPKTIAYQVAQRTGPVGIIEFNKRGIAQVIDTAGNVLAFSDVTLQLNSTNDADYDCIVISQTRTAMGKWNVPTAGVCNVK